MTETYFEQGGKRLDSFNRAIRHIARVVRSEGRAIAVSTTSTASASVTCSRQENCPSCLQCEALKLYLLKNGYDDYK